MSGQRQPDDEPDFLDDDFIIDEETTGKDAGPDLPSAPAAAAPQPPRKATPAGAAPRAPGTAESPGEGDEDDLLFTDHTPAVNASTQFGNGSSFEEAGASAWRGDQLDLDDVGAPAADAAAPPAGDPMPVAAQGASAEPLDSLLQGDDDFVLDSERELELVDDTGAPRAEEQPNEGEPQDTFVLDDGDGLLQDTAVGLSLDDAAPRDAAAEPEDGVPEATAAEGGDDFAAMEVGADEAPVEPGWEPLPATNMDQLAEVDEVARADESDPNGEAAEVAAEAATDGAPALMPVPGMSNRRPALAAAAAAAEELYVQEEPEAVVIGTRGGSGSFWRLAGSLAASLAVFAAGAVVVMRPEWVGLRFQPERVETVHVQRPVVQVALPAPVVPVPVASTEPATTEPVTPPPTGNAPAEPQPGDGTPAVPTPAEPPADPVQPPPTTTPTEPPPVTPPAEGVVIAPPTVPGDEPSATPVELPTEPAPAVVAAPAEAWPAPQMPVVSVPQRVANDAPNLVRVSDDLVIGGPVVADPVATRRAVEGMLPGSRAFAQLHNGNYFIGSVKYLDPDRITLRVDSGEVTLQVGAIARLTALGSSDYEELQKVTSGFVRLTNNNRLVGGILRGIADDHIILEYRSNRVMLPKTAVGEVVESAGDSGVRLDTTREEDDWLRELAERQLGSGRGAEPATKPSATPPANSRGPR
jgi:hypothetical protein